MALRLNQDPNRCQVKKSSHTVFDSDCECVRAEARWKLLQRHEEHCFIPFCSLIDLMIVFSVHSSIRQGLLAG